MVFWAGQTLGAPSDHSTSCGGVALTGYQNQHPQMPMQYPLVALFPVVAAGVIPQAAGFVVQGGVLPTLVCGIAGIAQGVAQGVAAVALGQKLRAPGGATSAGVRRSKTPGGRQQRRGRGARAHASSAATPQRRRTNVENNEAREEDSSSSDGGEKCEHQEIEHDHVGNPQVERLRLGGSDRHAMLGELHGQVAHMAFKSDGCRVVQLALEVGSQECSQRLASELRGLVVEAARSPHANFVLQKAVEVLPACSLAFVAEELMGACAADMACHRFGCRIFCRLAEHHLSVSGTSTPNTPAAQLLDDVLRASAPKLCCNEFGRHVIVAALEHGGDTIRSLVLDAILLQPTRFAMNRNASLVVERALTCGDAKVPTFIAAKLLYTPRDAVELAMNRFGRHVLQLLAELPPLPAGTASGRPSDAADALRATKHGRRVLARIRRNEGVHTNRDVIQGIDC